LLSKIEKIVLPVVRNYTTRVEFLAGVPPQFIVLEPHPVSHFLQIWKTLQDLWSYSESSRMTQSLAKQITQIEESEKLQQTLTKSA
jgi:hypothetical protein